MFQCFNNFDKLFVNFTHILINDLEGQRSVDCKKKTKQTNKPTGMCKVNMLIRWE